MISVGHRKRQGETVNSKPHRYVERRADDHRERTGGAERSVEDVHHAKQCPSNMCSDIGARIVAEEWIPKLELARRRTDR